MEKKYFCVKFNFEIYAKVYYENNVPFLYTDDVEDEDAALKWLIYQRHGQTNRHFNMDRYDGSISIRPC